MQDMYQCKNIQRKQLTKQQYTMTLLLKQLPKREKNIRNTNITDKEDKNKNIVHLIVELHEDS